MKKFTDEKIKKANPMWRTVEAIREFENKVNLKLMNHIFGEEFGQTHWENFVLKSERSFIKFYRTIDIGHQTTLFCHIFDDWDNRSSSAGNPLYSNC